MNSPTLALCPLAVLSLYCVIRFISPIAVWQASTQPSSACWLTWLWQNTAEVSGSTPPAMNCAAVTRVRRRSTSGSVGTVSACRSATK